MELMSCPSMAVPNDVMQHVVHVESAFNPYAIGVVGARLARQPRSLVEALATVRMLEARVYNFSVGLAQVNRHNLARQGLASYERAFESCPNLQAGSRILSECYERSGRDWGKAFSCYYSGNFITGFQHGYVQKIFDSMRGQARLSSPVEPIGVVAESRRSAAAISKSDARSGGHAIKARSRGQSQSDREATRIRSPVQQSVGDADVARVAGPSVPSSSGDHAFVF
jgi:type IV secretion system protein VirB1